VSLQSMVKRKHNAYNFGQPFIGLGQTLENLQCCKGDILDLVT